MMEDPASATCVPGSGNGRARPTLCGCDAMRLIREAVGRALRPEDFLLPDTEASRAVCFLMTGERGSMEGAIRRLQRTVADRLGSSISNRRELG